jgi:hypothetical protein
MFYPITSPAARQRKGEFGAFGRVDTAAGPWPDSRISPRDKRILED